MTTISQEAREAAYELAVIIGRIPPERYRDNFMSGEWDGTQEVQAFATFEAQIEARRTPPSDELREKVAEIITRAIRKHGSTTFSSWARADDATREIIALLPGGGGERECDGCDGTGRSRNSQLWPDYPPACRYCAGTGTLAPSPTIPTDLVERLRKLLEALNLAANRLDRLALETKDGGRMRANATDWTAEARTAHAEGIALLDAIEGKK